MSLSQCKSKGKSIPMESSDWRENTNTTVQSLRRFASKCDALPGGLAGTCTTVSLKLQPKVSTMSISKSHVVQLVKLCSSGRTSPETSMLWRIYTRIPDTEQGFLSGKPSINKLSPWEPASRTDSQQLLHYVSSQRGEIHVRYGNWRHLFFQ